MPVMAGTGTFMGNGNVFEVPPPGDGLKTVTLAVPAVARSLAGTVAVS